jgi:fucose permease
LGNRGSARDAVFPGHAAGLRLESVVLCRYIADLVHFFIRRSVPEQDIYREQGRAEPRRDPLAIFGRAAIRRTALGALLAVGAQGGYYAITTWLPTFLQKERGLTILSSGGYLAVIIVGLLSGI